MRISCSWSLLRRIIVLVAESKRIHDFLIPRGAKRHHQAHTRIDDMRFSPVPHAVKIDVTHSTGKVFIRRNRFPFTPAEGRASLRCTSRNSAPLPAPHVPCPRCAADRAAVSASVREYLPVPLFSQQLLLLAVCSCGNHPFYRKSTGSLDVSRKTPRRSGYSATSSPHGTRDSSLHEGHAPQIPRRTQNTLSSCPFLQKLIAFHLCRR